MDVFAAFIAPALAGVFVGVMSGLLGVGGGTIMVPIFRLAFGMSPLASTATSLFAIIPTSISGVVAHARAKTCVPKLGLALGVGGAVMSPLGVWLASVSPGWLVICVAAIVIGFSAFKMFKKAVKCAPAPRAGAASAHSASPKPVPDQPHLSRKQYLQGACIGLIAGLASGTSLIAIMILAIPGVIEQGLLGNIEYLAGIAIVVGSIPGALVGARLVRVVPERQLRFIFGGFLLVAAVMLMLNEFGILG
ncbi:MAG: sulfite exporter TauE/SafE family protein [Senegalimassilia anaerobia]|nr:sulfite exporter TauE/SafE family protein [Senegalimassilia anaerobia]